MFFSEKTREPCCLISARRKVHIRTNYPKQQITHLFSPQNTAEFSVIWGNLYHSGLEDHNRSGPRTSTLCFSVLFIPGNLTNAVRALQECREPFESAVPYISVFCCWSWYAYTWNKAILVVSAACSLVLIRVDAAEESTGPIP